MDIGDYIFDDLDKVAKQLAKQRNTSANMEYIRYLEKLNEKVIRHVNKCVSIILAEVLEDEDLKLLLETMKKDKIN